MIVLNKYFDDNKIINKIKQKKNQNFGVQSIRTDRTHEFFFFGIQDLCWNLLNFDGKKKQFKSKDN